MQYKITIDLDTEDLKQAKNEIKNHLLLPDDRIISIETENQKRTDVQNRALHLWFEQLAEALSDAGYDVKTTLKDGISVPWSKVMVKELLWRPTQKVFLDKNSTTKLSKKQEIDQIYDIINLTIGERTGVYVPFPSEEELSWRYKNNFN